MSLEELGCEYGRSRVIVARDNQKSPPRDYCCARITETIIILTYLFGRLALEDPLLPKRSGILNIYHDERVSIADKTFSRRLPKDLRTMFDPEQYLKSLSFLLARYVSMFSEEPTQYSMGASMSALVTERYTASSIRSRAFPILL